MDIHSLLSELLYLTRPSDITKRLKLAKAALDLVGRDTKSELWAWLQCDIGISLVENPQGSKEEDLKRAIVHLDQALKFYTKETHPKNWAVIQNTLANANLKGISEDSEDNLDRVIAYFNKALEVFTKESDPFEWAAIHNNIGFTLIKYKNEEFLEQAIQHFNQALEVRTQETYPIEWAQTQNNLATAYLELNNYEQTIECCNQALKVYTFETNSHEWATIQQRIGVAYCYMKDEGDNSFNQAITYFKQALRVYTLQANPYLWAVTQEALGATYKNLHGERMKNFEQAIEHFKQALEVYTIDTYPKQWAGVQVSLAMAYKFRIGGERSDNLEHAKNHVEQALKVYTPQTYKNEWAYAQNVLGEIFNERILGDPGLNNKRASEHYQQALEVYTQQIYPEEWAIIQNDLGNNYLNYFGGMQADYLDLAISYFEKALEVYNRQAYPKQWALTQSNLGNAYSKRIYGDPIENSFKAIAHYEKALEVRTRQADPEKWALIQQNLAATYSCIHSKRIVNVREVVSRPKKLREAISCLKQALNVWTLEQFPTDYQVTQRSLGNLFFDEKQWAEALAAYEEAINAEHILLAAAYTDRGRQAEVAETSHIYAHVAYSLLKLDRLDEALMRLEQGKTRLLSRAMALNELDLSLIPAEFQEALRSLRQTIHSLESEMQSSQNSPQHRYDSALAEALAQNRMCLNEVIETIRKAHPDFMPEGLNLEEILALIPKDAVLLAPIITLQGSAMFVVPGGLQSINHEHVLWLDDFKLADLHALLFGPTPEEQLGGWLGAYLNSRSNEKAWFDAIETTGQELWNHLMGPISEHLASYNPQHILLMPQGGLGLLPLHAAWHEEHGERRYLIDDYTVTYVPGAYELSVCQSRLRDGKRQIRSLLAIINPTEDLLFTPIEGEQITHMFDEKNSTVITGIKATPYTVTQGVASYLHFACHSLYNWNDPMQSCLVLANEERFTLAHIIGQLNLEHARLVTLSACETGITDIRQSPDEYLGLPAGFLQAGAPAVVSTLWAVQDMATSLLVGHFYLLHFGKDKSSQNTTPICPASALCMAQKWLRDTTAKTMDLARYFEDVYHRSGRRDVNALQWMRYYRVNPNMKPFNHPYYWAGFIFSGA